MADAPDPDGAKDGAKDDAAPAAATPPDQGSAMELELSQALIEVTLFAGPAFGNAIPRYFTEEQLRELMARLENAQLYMRGLREENPAAATRASSPKGRAWLATSPRRMLEQRALRATSWKDFTEEEVAAMSAAMRSSLTSRLAAKAREEAEALAAEVSRGRRRSTKLSRSLPLWKRPTLLFSAGGLAGHSEVPCTGGGSGWMPADQLAVRLR